jgi:transposase
MMNPTELESLNAPQLRELTRELVEQLSAQQHKNSESAQTIASLKRELLFKRTRIEQLTYELARYKRLRFARSSEKLDAVQASLLEEALDSDLAAIEAQFEQLRARPKSAPRHQPRREVLPAHLPRVAVHPSPNRGPAAVAAHSSASGRTSRRSSPNEPGVFTVERHIRGKWACAKCQTLTQARLPAQIIDKGIGSLVLLG